METRPVEEIEAATEKLLRDLQTVIHDGEELLKASLQNLTEHGVAAREKLAAAIEMAKETREKLQQRVVSTARAADRQVREHPYQSVGIAFGIGLLLGLLANRK